MLYVELVYFECTIFFKYTEESNETLLVLVDLANSIRRRMLLYYTCEGNGSEWAVCM